MATGAQYSYDKLGRLTGISFDDGSSMSYLYDDLGNRTCTLEVASCCDKTRFTIYTKSGNFTADAGAGSYYKITGPSAISMPASPGDGSVLKFKVLSGTGTFQFHGADVINHANGQSNQSLELSERSGVIELTSSIGGWDET